jgi:hypothetical protein
MSLCCATEAEQRSFRWKQLETIVGFTALVVVSITLFGTVIDGVYVSIICKRRRIYRGS